MQKLEILKIKHLNYVDWYMEAGFMFKHIKHIMQFNILHLRFATYLPTIEYLNKYNQLFAKLSPCLFSTSVQERKTSPEALLCTL